MKTLKSSSRNTVCLLQVSAPIVVDPAFTPFVTASIEEIRHAQRLRERIEERYLNRPNPPVSFWSVGPTDRAVDSSLDHLVGAHQARLGCACLNSSRSMPARAESLAPTASTARSKGARVALARMVGGC